MFNKSYIQNFKNIKLEIAEFYKQRLKITENFKFDVSSSTYRVFKHTKQKPSLVFKSWAFSMIKNGEFLDDLSKIEDKKYFYDLHEKYSNSLSLFWSMKQSENLATPYKYKLIDLFFKSISICDFGNEAINKNILKYANSPLDSITLNCLDLITNGKFGLKNKAMGFVKTKEIYEWLQTIVFDFCEEVGASGLGFDYFSKVVIL